MIDDEVDDIGFAPQHSFRGYEYLPVVREFSNGVSIDHNSYTEGAIHAVIYDSCPPGRLEFIVNAPKHRYATFEEFKMAVNAYIKVRDADWQDFLVRGISFSKGRF